MCRWSKLPVGIRGSRHRWAREKDLVEKVESVSPDAFEEFTLQKHLKHLATFLSEDRVKHARSYMKSIFAEAVEQDCLLKDPTRGIKIPRNLREKDRRR